MKTKKKKQRKKKTKKTEEEEEDKKEDKEHEEEEKEEFYGIIINRFSDSCSRPSCFPFSPSLQRHSWWFWFHVRDFSQLASQF